MLSHLAIQNFAIVKSLDIEFHAGMTAVTGETGAGKSIAIDALGLCLGERAEASMVRKHAKKADLAATFTLREDNAAKQWLQEQDLEENDDQCIVRRVISAEGRSRAYINGHPVPLQQLKTLGRFLVNIHGQNAHQQLLKPNAQRDMLDQFAQHPEPLQAVVSSYQDYKQCSKALQQLQDEAQQREDRKQLLSYQVRELDDFAIEENEFAELESQFKKLSHSQTLMEQSQLCYQQLYDGDQGNAMSLVQDSLDRLGEQLQHDPQLQDIVNLLQEASIQIDEAGSQLRHYVDNLELDPETMHHVEQRFTQAMDLARKHHIQPEQLYHHHQALVTELAELAQDNAKIEQLQEELIALEQRYADSAEVLSASRRAAAQTLSSAVTEKLQQMNMPDAEFVIEVNPLNHADMQKYGLDDIVFTIASNKGLNADRIEKVASGGELSRIGLALQVLSCGDNAVPTMIFDEVDTGISGATASVVGQLLRTLGASTQVMCVTHLPQVAARAQQQMFVTKFSDGETTETHMINLSQKERIEELARLLAGDTLTRSALANAKALLKDSQV